MGEIRVLPRPRLRVVLFIVNLCVLLLPIAGILFLKIYESELIRQTEAALIGQAALLRANYRNELEGLSAVYQQDIIYKKQIPVDSPYYGSSRFVAIRPSLDMATAPILPPGDEALSPQSPPSRLNAEAGKNLQYLLKDSQRITLCGIRLVDSNGVVVASSGSELGLSIAGRQEVQRALDGYYASVLRRRLPDESTFSYSSLSRGGWVRVLVAMPVISNNRIVGAVLLSRSPLDVGKGLYFIRKHLITAGVVITVLVLGVTLFTDRLIGRPLKQLVEEAKRVAKQGGLPDPPKRPGMREIVELSDSITAMAGKLQMRSDYISNFARHVSHEFKTPLSSLGGTVELFRDMGEEMNDAERKKFLENMHADVQHLDRLTQGLLDLARADMSSGEKVYCDPATVLGEVEEYYGARSETVVIESTGGSGMVPLDGTVLRDILTNLVNNSIIHGQAQRVTIRCSPGRDENVVRIRVSDDGKGIPIADRERIFTPFFTTSRNQGGTGLGLSLCRSFIEAAGGTIILEDGSRGQCVFLINLPLSLET